MKAKSHRHGLLQAGDETTLPWRQIPSMTLNAEILTPDCVPEHGLSAQQLDKFGCCLLLVFVRTFG